MDKLNKSSEREPQRPRGAGAKEPAARLFLFEEHDRAGISEQDPRRELSRHRECPRDPRKIALLERSSAEAAEVFRKEIAQRPVLLSPNRHGSTDYRYVIEQLRAAGLATDRPLMMRLFAAERAGAMMFQGTDRQNGMNLYAHHNGRDGEWLAMWEHGLELSETGRTTYLSSFNERVAYDLLKSRSYALAIYDGRGLLACQPSWNATQSFSNGHHVFLVPPKDALLAVVRW